MLNDEPKTVPLVPLEELTRVARSCRDLGCLLAPFMVRVRSVVPADSQYHAVVDAIAKLREQSEEVLALKRSAAKTAAGFLLASRGGERETTPAAIAGVVFFSHRSRS